MAQVLAFSLSGSVDQLSVIVSIAALVGVAVLSLLAFAQARELKRLRDWAGKASERAEELERSIAARLRSAAPAAAAARQPAAEGRAMTPRTTPLVQRAVGSATAAATQVAPTASALAAATPTAAGTAVAGLPVAGELATPVVAQEPAKPALAAAVAAPVAGVADVASAAVPTPAVVAGATIAAPGQAGGNGQPPGQSELGDSGSRPTLPPAPAGGPRTAAAAAPRKAPPGATQAPRSAARQAGAAAGGAPRSPGAAARGRGGADRKPTIYRRERSSARRIALVAGGLVAVAVVVVVVISLTSSGGSAKPQTQTSPRGGDARRQAATQSHGSLHVVVLNATETDGLAAKVASTLKGSGYTRATALFGTPAGSYPATVVEYKRGHKAVASEVAKALHISQGNVRPLAQATAPLAAGAPLVVIVGGPSAATSESEASEGEAGSEEGEAAAEGETSTEP